MDYGPRTMDVAQATFRIWRGDAEKGEFRDYTAEVGEGMVVLDAVHQIQAESANDLACRWNCKAGKCGSCSAEINGKPRLMCMTRMNTFTPGETITVFFEVSPSAARSSGPANSVWLMVWISGFSGCTAGTCSG